MKAYKGMFYLLKVSMGNARMSVSDQHLELADQIRALISGSYF